MPDLGASVRRFSGFAPVYDAFRPRPPVALADVLCLVAGVERPALVVDLGSGTGGSTRYWAGRAGRALGVEPSADMRRQARAATKAANVAFVEGFSHETGLADACADLVTCSQSLHWMLPDETFAEAARILRPGGVFAAYDYDWPPLMARWEAEVAFRRFMTGVRQLEQEVDSARGVPRVEKSGHLERMTHSGRFRHTREFMLHSADEGDRERLVGLVLSLGGVQSLLKTGLTQTQVGLDRLREELATILGPGPEPWYWTYRLRIGIV